MLPKDYDPAFDYETAFDRELSERLRVTRRTLGITEREAAAAHVTVKTYRKWESGGRMRSSVDTLQRFCAELAVSFTWMVGGGGRFLARDYYERLTGPQRWLSDGGIYVEAVRH
jgi:transcriptional regulator with XRE-family HTH domain